MDSKFIKGVFDEMVKNRKEKDTKWEYISGVLISMRDRSDAMNKLMDAFDINPESALFKYFYEAHDDLISAMSLMVDDGKEAIEWYIYECDYGRKSMTAGVKENMKIIRTIDDLRWLVELWGTDD